MPKLLSQAAVDQYKREGYYSPVRVMSTAEAKRFRNALETHEGKTGKPLQGNWRHKMHLLFTWADELVHHPKAVSYTHLRAHETPEHLVCRLLLEKKKK